jgi:hypothetical protein
LFRARGYQGPYKGGPAAAGIRCWISGLSETHVSERRFRRETGKLTGKPARWSAHNSTKPLELATRD